MDEIKMLGIATALSVALMLYGYTQLSRIKLEPNQFLAEARNASLLR